MGVCDSSESSPKRRNRTLPNEEIHMKDELNKYSKETEITQATEKSYQRGAKFPSHLSKRTKYEGK